MRLTLTGVRLVKALLLASATMLLFLTIPPLTTAQEKGVAELKHVTTTPLNGRRPTLMAALSIERGTQYPSVIRLKGSVEIKTPVCLPVGKKGAQVCDGEMIVRSDEAEFHEDTGEIQAHGNVQITPLRHRKY
jgi:lipopolysaccharide assembly outer membrane protein LptD (OstA)